MDWRHHSACRTEDPEVFFPEGSAAPAQRQAARAKQICARCPVIEPCLAVALATGQQGVWGGMDDLERRRLRRTLRDQIA